VSDEATGRVPPSNLDNEASVLGGIFLRNDALDVVIERGLEAESFYHPRHRVIFEAMVALHESGQPIDIVTVADYLNSGSGQRRVPVSETLLADLAARVPTASNVGYYAKSVVDDAAIRRMISCCGEIVGKAFGHPADADEFLSWAERHLAGASERRERHDFVRVKTLAVDAMQRLETRHSRRDHVSGVTTGYVDLDRITTGLQPGDLVILAGRPSMGKTAAALNIALNAANTGSIPTLIFSLEMSKQALIDRLFCIEGRVDSQRMRSGQLSSAEWAALTQTMARVSEMPIDIDDSGVLKVAEIRAKARRWRRDRKLFPTGTELGLIVVDYLQQVDGGAGKQDDSRDREIGRISRAFKSLAKELAVPVLALSQLNRGVEKRDNKRPNMGDLRESGNLEQDADVVVFLYRECMYERTDDNGRDCEAIVGKQRNGPVGTVKLCFFEENGRFENMAQERRWTGQETLPLDRRAAAAGDQP
jgi:replicative DNA helicase